MTQRLVTYTLVSTLLAPACVVKDLELGDTDDAEASSGEGGAMSETTDAQDTGPGSIPTDPARFAEDIATQRCAAMQACSCFAPEDRWADPEVCEADIRDSLQLRAELALGSGLHVDPACWAMQLDQLAGDDCAPAGPQEQLAVEVAAFCPLFVGDGQQGDACERLEAGLSFDSTCAAGLVCDDGACAAMPTLGDPCIATLPMCALDATCVNGTCSARGGIGDACDDWTCDVALRCGDDEVCEPRTGPGGSCEYSFECSSGRCRDAQCEPQAAALCGPYVYELPPE